MKKILKKAVAFALCAVMLMSVGIPAASAYETDCEGTCEHSPVIVLPGINHSPTYLYDENDNPVMNGDTQIGGTLFILNESALSTTLIIKAVLRLLATITFQTNVGLDTLAYDMICASSPFLTALNKYSPIKESRSIPNFLDAVITLDKRLAFKRSPLLANAFLSFGLIKS